MKNELAVVIPVYNEEESLKTFLPRVIDYCRERAYALIVVNDGSDDRTGEIMDSLAGDGSLTALHHKLNRGYGAAIKSGIRAADSKYVVTIDGDGQHELQDIEKLLAVILEKNADMVVGRREGIGSDNVYRNTGKRLIRTFAKCLMPVPIQDINSGMKIYRAALAKRYMRFCPDGMPYSDIITLTFIYQHHRVLETAIQVNPRSGGASTVNTATAFETVMEILHILMSFNPMRAFIPLAVGCMMVGVLWGLPIIWKGRGVSVGAMLMIVTGLLFFSLGLIAGQLSTLRKAAMEDNPTNSGPVENRHEI